MSRNSRNRDGGDERIGRSHDEPRISAQVSGDEDSSDSKYGEPLLPIVDDAAGDTPVERVAGDSRYARDTDRMQDEREYSERELTDEDRLELFRSSLFQNSLPTLPPIKGYHLCWLTTTNPRDSIHSRLRLGYELIRADEIPGWEYACIASGDYAGCVGINEMIAAKLPLRLYELYMTEAHHNAPLAEEGKLTSALEAVREQVGKKTQVFAEEGMAALGKPRRPRFEGVSG